MLSLLAELNSGGVNNFRSESFRIKSRVAAKGVNQIKRCMAKKTLKTASAQIADVESMIDEITETLRETARKVVPGFVERMPLVYFQDTDRSTQLSHLRAIIAAEASGRSLELSLGTEDGSEVTYIRPSDYPGVLAEVVRELPLDRPIRAAKIHTATDGSLVVDTFVFGESDRYDGSDREQMRKLDQTIKYAAKHLPEWSPEDIADYFNRCRADYILTLTPLRICHQREHFKRFIGTFVTADAF